MEVKALLSKHKNKIPNILIILVAVYFASMLYKKQVENTNLLVTQKETETKKNALLKDIGIAENKFKDYADFINTKDIATVINNLNSLARASNVKIISIRPSGEQAFPVYTRFPFELIIEVDSYHSLGKFISSVENHNDIYTIESAKIRPQSSTQEGVGPVRLTVDIRVSTILLKK